MMECLLRCIIRETFVTEKKYAVEVEDIIDHWKAVYTVPVKFVDRDDDQDTEAWLHVYLLTKDSQNATVILPTCSTKEQTGRVILTVSPFNLTFSFDVND